jgi:hypothetical protein
MLFKINADLNDSFSPFPKNGLSTVVCFHIMVFKVDAGFPIWVLNVLTGWQELCCF